MFELDANNFSDKDGNIKRGQYFEDGYLDTTGDKPPNFLENLLSGGKLQRDFDDRKTR